MRKFAGAGLEAPGEERRGDGQRRVRLTGVAVLVLLAWLGGIVVSWYRRYRRYRRYRLVTTNRFGAVPVRR